MLKNPIKYHLYNEDGTVKEGLTLCLIPWGIAKKAIAMSKHFNEDGGEEDDSSIDAMAQFASDLFHGKFTAQDVNDYGDIKETKELFSKVMGYINSDPNSEAGTPETVNPQK
ncbi:MAG: hypothetical protein ABF904_11755 [Ethanoligenens sp.]